ncbi:OIP5 [Acrasis kona]|uniref:OIP5 n=1 Tax=Acrasis kona TaxID=1008807 RepID=A0AAW2Z807_9EUKA
MSNSTGDGKIRPTPQYSHIQPNNTPFLPNNYVLMQGHMLPPQHNFARVVQEPPRNGIQAFTPQHFQTIQTPLHHTPSLSQQSIIQPLSQTTLTQPSQQTSPQAKLSQLHQSSPHIPHLSQQTSPQAQIAQTVVQPTLTPLQSPPKSVPDAVFQCLGCREILADSKHFVCTFEETESVVFKQLADTASIGHGISTVTDQDAMDNGCTYNQIKCNTCGIGVGKKYVDTAGIIQEEFKNTFCLERRKLKGYRIGEAADVNSNKLTVLPSLIELQEVKLQLEKFQKAVLIQKEMMEDYKMIQSQQAAQIAQQSLRMDDMKQSYEKLSQEVKRLSVCQSVMKIRQEEQIVNIKKEEVKSKKRSHDADDDNNGHNSHQRRRIN